jgi:hypothetical protein
MTKEQMINHLRIMRSGVKRAINCIENLKELSEEDKKDRAILKVQLEAFNMAMELLEQQPCDDCVSRRAVLDLAETIQTDDFSGNEIIEVVDIDDVKTLPPVTPTHGTCKDCEKNKGVCLKFLKEVKDDFYCKDFEKRGDLDGSN